MVTVVLNGADAGAVADKLGGVLIAISGDRAIIANATAESAIQAGFEVG